MPKFTLILEGDSIDEVIAAAQTLTREACAAPLMGALDHVGDKMGALREAIDEADIAPEPLENERPREGLDQDLPPIPDVIGSVETVVVPAAATPWSIDPEEFRVGHGYMWTPRELGVLERCEQGADRAIADYRRVFAGEPEEVFGRTDRSIRQKWYKYRKALGLPTPGVIGGPRGHYKKRAETKEPSPGLVVEVEPPPAPDIPADSVEVLRDPICRADILPEPPGVDMDAVFAIDVGACRFGRGFRWTDPELHFLNLHEDATTLYGIYRDVFGGTPVAAFNRSENAVLQKWKLCRKAEGLESLPKKPVSGNLTEEELDQIQSRSQELTDLMLRNAGKYDPDSLETISTNPEGQGVGSDPDNKQIRINSKVVLLAPQALEGLEGLDIKVQTDKGGDRQALLRMKGKGGRMWVLIDNLEVVR